MTVAPPNEASREQYIQLTIRKCVTRWNSRKPYVFRPDANQIHSRTTTFIFKEDMQIPVNVIDELTTGVGSDIRQVLNILSTWKLHNNTMDYDEGKKLYV